MAPLPKIKQRVVTTFPASVEGRKYITVSKENGIYYFDFDASDIGTVPDVPDDDKAQTYVLVWDKLTNSPLLVEYNTFASSGGDISGLLEAISELSDDGLIVKTGTDTAGARTITGTANEIDVADGDGVSGNPTVSLPDALTFTGKTVTGGTLSGVGIDAGSNTVSNIDTTMFAANVVDNDSSLTANSSSRLPTQAAVKAYAVTGPASSTSGNIATFNGTGGKVVQDGGKALPTGSIVGTTDSQTLTNKTLTAPAISSPTGIVKSDVGLGNVDNTADTDKPVSTATQTALDAKADETITVTGTGNLSGGGDLSANRTLDMANMAQATIKGRASGAGTGAPIDLSATQATAILNAFVGDSGSGGTKGLVPAPASGDASKFLKGDGTFGTPAGSGDFVGPSSSTDNTAVRFDSTTGKLGQGSVLIIDDTTGRISRSGGGGIQQQGTSTNDDAASGDVGEYLSSFVAVSTTSLTTATYANSGATITLTAGDWEVESAAQFQPTASTSITSLIATVSATSGASDTSPDRFNQLIFAPVVPGSTIVSAATPQSRFTVANGNTLQLYLVCRANFTASTLTCGGKIWARRVR